MKSLYLRIYLTVVVVLAAFAFGSAWLFQRQMEQERGNFDAAAVERLVAIGMLVHRALPPVTAPEEDQAMALRDWGQRLRMAFALDNAKGERVATTELYTRRERLLDDESSARRLRVPLGDGRTLTILRTLRPPAPGAAASGAGGIGGDYARPRRDDPGLPFGPLFGNSPEALIVLLVMLFIGVAVGAYPVVRRLTRRLETLQRGVESFGAGTLSQRVDVGGRDEVASLASSFNRAATRIEALLAAQKSLLANASHELRSPLARLKMALALQRDASPAAQARLQTEVETNIAELDQLVEEVLLASRLEGSASRPSSERIDLLGLAAEEAAHTQVEFDIADGITDMKVLGEERLLRRALRNLLENARRYGGPDVRLELRRSQQSSAAELRVSDRGPGVPLEMRERIFEPFFRLPGHAEQAGGVGLGLSLVRQIAQQHRGAVHCEERAGGGSCFVLSLPLV